GHRRQGAPACPRRDAGGVGRGGRCAGRKAASRPNHHGRGRGEGERLRRVESLERV
ncbi:MAG: hypothetical protein AVDCRST_MAG19-1919, partial [uncultured Thermomicrobiales bacterium]